MGRIACQYLLGAGLVALLATASAVAAPAPDTPASPEATAPKAAADAAKPVKPATKTTAKKPDAAHAASTHKPADTPLASTPKKPAETHKTAASAPKKTVEPLKAAAVTAKKPSEPPKTTAATAAGAQTASYTITTTRDNFTYRTTRTVAVPETAPPAAKVAAAPVSPPAESRSATTMVAPGQAVAAITAAVPAIAAARPPVMPAAATPVRPDPGQAASFVAGFLGEAFRIARSTGATALQRRAQLADLFSAKMDVGQMAVSTAANELNATTADIQRRFRTILVSYLVETYYPRIELASDAAVKVETVAATPLPDGTAVVWTIFSKSGWSPQSVKWHLTRTAQGYRIVDILTAGASLVQMERDTFASVMRNGGLPELMAKLDARTKALASAAP